MPSAAALFPHGTQHSDGKIGLTDILRTLQNLGLTVIEELRVPLTLPEHRKAVKGATSQLVLT